MSKRQAFQFAIVGGSGRGKTYSFRNMNPDTCGFINLEGKPLPFINNFKHYAIPNDWQEAYKILVEFAKNPEITEVVFESFSSYSDSLLRTAREIKKGFDVWNYYNSEIAKLQFLFTRYPKDIFVSGHPELVQTPEGTVEKRIGVKGNEHKVTGVEKDYVAVIYAEAKKDSDNKTNYYFRLTNNGDDSAKTPPFLIEALGGTNEIPNDCNAILQKLRELLN
jgi:hypothetical protein